MQASTTRNQSTASTPKQRTTSDIKTDISGKVLFYNKPSFHVEDTDFYNWLHLHYTRTAGTRGNLESYIANTFELDKEQYALSTEATNNLHAIYLYFLEDKYSDYISHKVTNPLLALLSSSTTHG